MQQQGRLHPQNWTWTPDGPQPPPDAALDPPALPCLIGEKKREWDNSMITERTRLYRNHCNQMWLWACGRLLVKGFLNKLNDWASLVHVIREKMERVNCMPTLKGIIVFRLIWLILQLIIYGNINNNKKTAEVCIKKSTDAKHAWAVCRAWRECRTCHNMLSHKNATGRKKPAIEEKNAPNL